MQFEKRRFRDCCSGKSVYSYRLSACVDESVLDTVKAIEPFQVTLSEERRFLLRADGAIRLSGKLGGRILRIVITEDDSEFIAALDTCLRTLHQK